MNNLGNSMKESSKASPLPGLMKRTSQVDERDVKLKALQMQHSISRRIFSQESNPNFSSNRESASGTAGVPEVGGQVIGGNLGLQITSKISLDNMNNNNSPHSKNLQMEVNTPIIQHSGGDEQILQKKKQKGIFEEYQERWERNNKRIFRYLITWKVGDNGKIEDQLKLMITYLSIIFVVILFICGFATTFYFHMTNKENISDAITSQANTIITNGLIQYKNSTEYVFKGYEFVLNYLSELVLSKLEISYKIYNFSDIAQFPYKGPNRMRRKDQNNAKCVNYTGNVVFESHAVSLKCIDWYEFDTSVVPLVNDAVYQAPIDTATLNGAIDILNYVLESQIFDVFVTKIFKIYFGFEYRTAMFGYPGWMMSNVPDTFPMHDRPWYNHTRLFHINQKDESVFRVISTPYYDTGTNTRVVTISRAILAPSASDVDKRYLVGKGRFMGVASVDIKLKEFQELFEDITFYSTGYLAIVNTSGKLLNEPSEFITQAKITGTYEDLDINELLEEEDWQVILNSKEDQLLSQVTSIHGLKLVVASTINSANFYSGEALVILLIIPYSEVYGEISTQNNNNLKNILISSMVSLAVFIVSTIICMVYVKKKIVHMVSAITELNKCALSLTSSNANQQEGAPENGTGAAPNAASSIPGKNPTTSVPAVNNGNNNNTNDQQVESSHSKKQVMERLNAIQQNSESETIKELVKGFENQLKGISKLGKGGQNILKNGKSTLKYEQAEYGGTQLPNYIEPLLGYLNAKKEKMDSEPSFQLSQYSAVSQLQIKTLTNQFKKPPNTLSSQMNIVTPRNLSVDNNNNNLQNQMFFNGLNSNMNTSDRDKEQPSHRQKQEAPEINQNISGNNNNNNNNSNGNNDQLVDLAQFDNDTIDIDMISMKENPHHP